MKHLRKPLSILLAVVMLAALCIAPVFAEYTSDIYSLGGSPRVANPNIYYQNGGYAISEVHLMHNWMVHAEAQPFAFCIINSSNKYPIAYCMEPSVNFSGEGDDNRMTQYPRTEDYLENIANQSDYPLTKDDVSHLMSLVLGNGYSRTISYYDLWNVTEDCIIQDPAYMSQFKQIWATQVLLWEIVVGERSATFEHIDPPAGTNKVKDVIGTGSVLYPIDSAYNDIVNKVRAALNLPSFVSETEEKTAENTYQLEYNDGIFSVTLTDETGVLASYTPVSTPEGAVQFTKNGNSITITSTEPLGEEVKVEFYNRSTSSAILILSNDGVYSASSSAQDVTVPVASSTYTNRGWLYLEATLPEVDINKVSANPDCTVDNPNYTLEGAVYGVYTEGNVQTGEVSGLVGTITTDADGKGSLVDGLEIGTTYYVKEITASKGFKLDTNVYPVTPTGGKTASATVTSVENPINDPLTITLTKQTANPVANTTPLTGTQFTVKYYAIDPDTEQTVETLASVTADRTWVIEVKARVNSEGETVYDTALTVDYIVDSLSDDLYFTGGGNETMPVGYFTIKETKAADGYILDSGTISIGGQQIATGNATIVGKVGYDGKITPEYLDITQEATITNQQILGNVNIVKLDDQDETHQVAGATFELYQDTNENGVLDDGEPLFDSLIDNGDGTYSYRELPQGYYILVESQAPYHFEIIDNNWPVVIAEDGDTINFTIENCHLYGDAFFTDPDVSKEYRWDVSISADTGEHINPYLWIAIVLSLACFCGGLTLPKYVKEKEKRVKDATPIIWILMLAVLLSSVTVPAYASTTGEDTQTVTIEFESYNKEDEASVIAWLNANGYSDYTIDSITYNVVDETTGQTNVVVVTNLISKDEAEAYLTDENGLTATLSDIVWKEVKRVRVSAWKDYENAGDAPRTMGTKVKIGDREFDVVLKLTSLTEQPGHKVHDVVFEGRFPVDFDEIKLADGTVVNVSSSSPCFEGYQTKILELQQVEEPDKYKITSGKWTGKTEEIDGVTYRIAEYYGTYTEDGKYFHAIYEEDVNGPYGTIYEAEIHYGNGVEEGKTQYKVKATVTLSYKGEETQTRESFFTPGRIAIGVGLLALIIALIIILTKKKQKDDVKEYNDMRNNKK